MNLLNIDKNMANGGHVTFVINSPCICYIFSVSPRGSINISRANTENWETVNSKSKFR